MSLSKFRTTSFSASVKFAIALPGATLSRSSFFILGLIYFRKQKLTSKEYLKFSKILMIKGLNILELRRRLNYMMEEI